MPSPIVRTVVSPIGKAASNNVANIFFAGYAYGVFCGAIAANIVIDAKNDQKFAHEHARAHNEDILFFN